jgi:hypothetical protein
VKLGNAVLTENRKKGNSAKLTFDDVGEVVDKKFAAQITDPF